MNLQRDRVRMTHLADDEEEEHVEDEPAEIFGMVWEQTCIASAFRSGERAERRLQRDVTHFVGRKSQVHWGLEPAGMTGAD